MKKEYDFSKAKKRSDRVKVDPQAAKIPTSIRLDGSILAWYKTEAERQGIPYQTLVCSILHRYANSELVDKTEVKRLQKVKETG
jgi:predicted DNA binding CopG/RHH family protein